MRLGTKLIFASVWLFSYCDLHRKEIRRFRWFTAIFVVVFGLSPNGMLEIYMRNVCFLGYKICVDTSYISVHSIAKT